MTNSAKALALAKAFVLMVFPPLSWVPKYSPKSDLGRDLVGGLVMGVMFVPMGLAYAALIGIPLHIGLYSSAVYTAVYGIFGNVASLSMGPVAEISLLLLGDSTLPDDPSARATVVQAIAFQVGVLSLGLAIFQGGVIIRNCFAREVGNAYATAAGIILIAVQLKDAFNIRAKSSVLLHEAVESLVRGLIDADVNTVYSLIFFLVLFAYLLVAKRVKAIPSWVPHQLVVLVVGILVTWGLRLDERANLSIVKDIPSDFPPVGVPDVSTFADTIVTSVVITLIAFLQMYSIATRMSSNVRANQELFASGMCAIVAGFLGGIPGSSSFSRCSVLGDLKVRTPLNCFFAGIVVFGCAAGLTRFGVFYYLPKLALSAIIVSSVYKLVNFDHALWLFKLFKVDFLVWLVVFTFTLFLGVAFGILGGIALSIVVVLFRVGVPKSYALAFDPLAEEWVDATEDDELLIHREVHVWRFDSPLYFVNVSYVTPQLVSSMDSERRPIRVVVVDCRHIHDVDASSIESFTVQMRNLEKNKSITIVLAGMPPKLAAALLRVPAEPFAGETFETVAAAVRHADVLVMTQKKLLAPHRPVPAALYRNSLAGGFAVDDAVGIVAVVSHADRSPKQKLKLAIAADDALATLLAVPAGMKETAVVVDATSPHTLQVIQALEDWPRHDRVQRRVAATLARLMRSLIDGGGPKELRDSFRAVVKRKDKKDKTGNADGGRSALQLVVKWGGTITDVGSAQAEACGFSLARRLGLGQEAQRQRRGPNAPTRRVEVGVTSNGEERVLVTGVAFSGAFAEAVETEGPANFVVDTELQRPSQAAKAFEDECLERVSTALHARKPREILLALDVPGMRTIVHRAERHHGGPHHANSDTNAADDAATGGAPAVAHRYEKELQGTPCRLLWDAAELTADLVAALDAAAERHARDADGDDAREPADPVDKSGAATTVLFANEESAEDMGRRYAMALSQFLMLQQLAGGAESDGEGEGGPAIAAASAGGGTAPAELVGFVRQMMPLEHRFDVSKITALYDNATYDVIQNSQRLEKICGFDMRPLLATLQPLYVAVSAGRFGVSAPARQIAGALVGLPLLQSMQRTVQRQIAAHQAALAQAVDDAIGSGAGGDANQEPPVEVAAPSPDAADSQKSRDPSAPASPARSIEIVQVEAMETTSVTGSATVPFATWSAPNAEDAAGSGEHKAPTDAADSPHLSVSRRRVSLLPPSRGGSRPGTGAQWLALSMRKDASVEGGAPSSPDAKGGANAAAAADAGTTTIVIAAPETEALPVELVFTSSAMITALRHALATSDAMRRAANPHAREILSRADTGWHYMSHVVFTVTYRPVSADAARARAHADADSAGSVASYLKDYVVDVYLSTGAALGAEASQRLQDGESDEGDDDGHHDTGDDDVKRDAKENVDDEGDAPTDRKGAEVAANSFEAADAKVLAVAGARADAADDPAARQAQQAARYLTKVSPMLRVWRLPAADFVALINETEALTRRWDA